MRKMLFASAILGGLFMLSGQSASAAPVGMHQVQSPSAVTQVDYYWHRHHWHHRHWEHHHWRYWD